MAIEVEIKARVQDRRALQVRIGQMDGVGPPAVIDRDDWYLGTRPLFRLRREESGVLITTKEKSIQAGIETNVEHEFRVGADQFEGALAFFTALGYPVVQRKTKRGLSYSLAFDEALPAMTLELCEVSDLGWFLELEILLEDEGELGRAKRALREVLAALLIDDSQIESRPYLQLLAQSTG